MMKPEEKIKNLEELEFVVFCIENLAERLGDASQVYSALQKVIF